MDQQLIDLIGSGKKGKAEAGITFLDAPGEIDVKGVGEGNSSRYALKPLKELYAPGTDSPSVDPQDEQYMPLFLEIESQIARYYRQDDPGLTDGSVGLTLDQLSMDPESPPAGDLLARRIALGLRLCLSLNAYSRQEVRAALRKVKKSVDRHSKIDGRRGYLNFIVEFFGSRG
jgi:hypothetical protein